MNERRTWLAIGLSLAIYIGWQKFYLEPRMPAPQAASLTAQPQGQVANNPTTSSSSADPMRTSLGQATAAAAIPEQRVQLNLATTAMTVGNGTRLIESWVDQTYFQSNETSPFSRASTTPTPKSNIDLAYVTQSATKGTTPKSPGQLDFSFDIKEFEYLNQVRGELRSDPSKAEWRYEDSNVVLTKILEKSPSQDHAILTFSGKFKTLQPKHFFITLNGESHKDDPEAQDRQFVYYTQNSLERAQIGESIANIQVATPTSYIGINSRYFLLSLIPEGGPTPAILQSIGPYQGRMSLIFPINGPEVTTRAKVYFGPKTLQNLRAVAPHLDQTVDFGWFTVIAYPLLKILQWFNSFFHNYGIAIILLTLLLKVVTYPLTYTSMKSMKKMAKVQPQLQALREKYKDDKETLNRETMTLMREGGYNPVAGCLPMLVTMPVFFALYRVLYSSIELYQAPFALWIHDLSQKDPYYVTPIVLTITMFFQTKLTPNTSTDPVQAKMMQFMPIMFGLMMLTLPSGLTIYMLINTVAGIVQQIILNKKFADPTSVSGIMPVRS